MVSHKPMRTSPSGLLQSVGKLLYRTNSSVVYFEPAKVISAWARAVCIVQRMYGTKLSNPPTSTCRFLDEYLETNAKSEVGQLKR